MVDREDIRKIVPEDKIGDVFLLMSGHDLQHYEEECKECSRKETKGWIRDIIKKGVYEGKRNITRFKIAVNLKKMGFPKKEIEKRIWEFNSNCKPPSDQREVDYHIKYMFRRWERGL